MSADLVALRPSGSRMLNKFRANAYVFPIEDEEDAIDESNAQLEQGGGTGDGGVENRSDEQPAGEDSSGGTNDDTSVETQSNA